jgi:uncharacterized spore protein YtfJ
MNANPIEPEEIEETEAVGMIQETMDKFLDTANVYAVYGEPVQHGDTAIIPTAEVLSVMGFGVGSGRGPSSVADDTGNVNGGSGSGGGGGGRVLSRPVAVIVASPEGVRVEPVLDVTKIALAALTAGGFMVGMIARMLNPRIKK